LQSFLRNYSTKSYKKNDVILQQDVEPGHAFIVKDGVIKTYNITSKGEEKPVGFNLANEIFPLGWVFGKICKSQYFYEALADSEVHIVPKDDLTRFLNDTPAAMLDLLNRCIDNDLRNQMRINALEHSKASEKVLHTIHYLALCFGRDLKTDIVEIPLPITQQDVANFTGLTRETISVELKKLAHQKIVLCRNRSYVVLTDRLDAILDDSYEYQLVR
jgi:CRP/FNR family transcriptional regulator